MRAHASSAPRTPAATSPAPRAARPGLASAIGNRAMAQLCSSPPSDAPPEALETELTTPGGAAPAAPAAPVIDATTRQIPYRLQVKGSGAIEGTYGISQYWPVTNYWGADNTLGEFTEPLAGYPGWKMIGHKFQVVGTFGSICVPGGGTGIVRFKQEARITNTKGGTPGPWFDDMHYTDAGGANHYWDPNLEAGAAEVGNGPGVRRTIAADKYAYTDPPAISYGPSTNTYRKLEFKIHLMPPAGSPDAEIVKEATQEIEVTNGVPTVLQAP